MISKTPALDKKIIELDPYKATVTTGNDSQVVQDDSTVAWEPDEEPSSDAAWVAATVKTGSSANARYTVRLPLPSAGKGLEANKEGVFDVSYDAETMEVTPSGKLSAKIVRPAGVKFVDGDFRVTDTPYYLDLGNATHDELYIQGEEYGGRVLDRGEIVVPGKYTWIKIEGFLVFSVERYRDSKWTYDCGFAVGPEEVRFSVDTTEQHTVVPFAMSVYNNTGNPIDLRARLTWYRSGEDDMGVNCGAHVTVTAN